MTRGPRLGAALAVVLTAVGAALPTDGGWVLLRLALAAGMLLVSLWVLRRVLSR